MQDIAKLEQEIQNQQNQVLDNVTGTVVPFHKKPEYSGDWLPDLLSEARYSLVIKERRSRWLPKSWTRTYVDDECYQWARANHLAYEATKDPMVYEVYIVIRMRKYRNPSEINQNIVSILKASENRG